MCWIAAAYLYAGQLHRSRQECLQVQHLLEQSGVPVFVEAYPAFDLSFLYYEWNQLGKAEDCLQTVIQHAYHWQDMSLLVWSYSASVRVLLASGKMVEAKQALQEAQNLIQQTGFTVYEPDAIAAQVSLWLAQDDLAAASTWAKQYIFNPEAPEYFRAEYIWLWLVSTSPNSSMNNACNCLPSYSAEWSVLSDNGILSTSCPCKS
jgi:LuxR family transcriptional regulator, maltose regulon positive regulatory protein